MPFIIYELRIDYFFRSRHWFSLVSNSGWGVRAKYFNSEISFIWCFPDIGGFNIYESDIQISGLVSCVIGLDYWIKFVKVSVGDTVVFVDLKEICFDISVRVDVKLQRCEIVLSSRHLISICCGPSGNNCASFDENRGFVEVVEFC